MKGRAILVFLCLAHLKNFAQQNNIIWSETQPLQWSDFEGQAIDSSGFDAESFAEVKYNYRFKSTSDFYFEVFANFNKNISWSRKEYQSDALLKHEQLHFDIAGLYAAKLKEAFERFRYTQNFRNEILAIFNEKKTEYQLLQTRYDDETNHSVNKEKQREWEKFIADELSHIKPRHDYAKNK